MPESKPEMTAARSEPRASEHVFGEKVLAARDASCLLCRKPWAEIRMLLPIEVTSPGGEKFAMLVCNGCFETLDERELRKEAE